MKREDVLQAYREATDSWLNAVVEAGADPRDGWGFFHNGLERGMLQMDAAVRTITFDPAGADRADKSERLVPGPFDELRAALVLIFGCAGMLLEMLPPPRPGMLVVTAMRPADPRKMD